MTKRYITKNETHLVDYKTDLDNCIIVDLDGTLSLLKNRSPYDFRACVRDVVNTPIKMFVKNCFDLNFSVFIITGRPEWSRPETERWLKENNIDYSLLFMRDSSDRRKDYEVKKEIFKNKIENKFNVFTVLEDRQQVVNMWRELGLQCWQVQETN
jgi:hypothetical protein